MGKKVESKQPVFVTELRKKGTVVITAKTIDELNSQIDSIPASCHYAAGAIGKNTEYGFYSLRLDIIND